MLLSKNPAFKNEVSRDLKLFSEAGSILLYEGTTELETLQIGQDVIIVDGNLIVKDYIQDCNGTDASLLIVFGDVRCRNLITLSGMFITGSLHAERTVLGDSLCDYVLKVGGDLTAKTIVNGGHFFETLGTIKADHILNTNGNVSDKNGVLRPNLADSDLMYDFTENPEAYKGFSYVELIDDVQKGGHYNLPRTIVFMKNGGEVFYKE